MARVCVGDLDIEVIAVDRGSRRGVADVKTIAAKAFSHYPFDIGYQIAAAEAGVAVKHCKGSEAFIPKDRYTEVVERKDFPRVLPSTAVIEEQCLQSE